MNQLERVKISPMPLMLGSLFLVLGFWLLSTFTWTWWGLLVGAIFAWLIVFKRASLTAFPTPHKLWVIPLGVIAYLLLGIIVGLLSTKLGFSWRVNPVAGHLLQVIFKIPLMLMGEELLGIGILEVARNQGASKLNSNLLSALIFGLMHVFVYWDGSIISTLLHVLLLQGVARLIFNYIYIVTGRSVWGSWLTHVLVDVIALTL